MQNYTLAYVYFQFWLAAGIWYFIGTYVVFFYKFFL